MLHTRACFETEAHNNWEMGYFDSMSYNKFVPFFLFSTAESSRCSQHGGLHYVSLGEEKSPDHIDANQAVSSNAELVKSWLNITSQYFTNTIIDTCMSSVL